MTIDNNRPRRRQGSKKDRNSIKEVLRPFKIKSRWTTFNSAFQSALAIPEQYDAKKAAQALKLLDQPEEGPLNCVYCGSAAQTWDHLNSIVRNMRYSGFGHYIFNLVPACRSCNERKGSKPWRDYLESLDSRGDKTRVSRLEKFAATSEAEQFSWEEIASEFPDQATRYDQLLESLKQIIEEADKLAGEIRTKVSARLDERSRHSR